MISCPGCGQGMRFEPKLQMMFCDYCETKLEPEVVTVGATASENNEVLNFDSTLFTCPQCGGEVLSDQDTAVTFCSYCGLSVELQGRAVKMQAPSKIIPFKCAKDACAKSYASFVKKAIYAPSWLREDSQLDKLRGIYMPYWSYGFNIDTMVAYEGTTSHRSGDYIITEHYQLSARPSGSYEGISYDASSSFSDELSQAIGPFNIRESKPFSIAYTSGFYADTADVDAAIYEGEARSIAARDIDAKIRKIPDFARFSVSPRPGQIDSSFISKAKEMAYFPVYFLANRHKNGLVSYAVINGQTGKVAADVPIDYKKYIIGSIILSIPIMILLDLFLVLRPDALTIVAIIFAVISMMISNKELNQIYTREQNLNDQGLLSAMKKRREEELRQAQQSIMASGEEVAQASGIAPVITEAEIKNNVNKINSIEKTANMFLTIGAVVFFMAIAIEVVELLGFSLIFFAIFGVMTISKNALKAKTQQSAMKNIGIEAKQPFKQKLPVLCKPLIAIIIGVILFIIRPYQDEIYYAISFVIMGIVIFSLSDVVRLHNKLTLRKPKQFNKRGGDENV